MTTSKGPVMIVAGTRPEAIKLAPVIWNLDRLGVDYVFVWSGQHYDYEMSQIFFEQLGLPEPDKYLGVGTRSADISEQVSKMITELVICIKETDPIFIYALGDTNTTLSAALASIYTTKPFVHDEAGMRSFDTAMLEEANRRIADTLANLRLAPTKIAVLNLLFEGIPYTTVKLVGSTVVDTLLKIVNNKELLRDDELLAKLSLERSQYILTTVHRRENLVNERLTKVVEILLSLASKLSDYKIVFPIHPHTKKRLIELGLLDKLCSYKNILLIKPLGYIEFITLLKNTRLVITDSGGVQEEAFILGKYIITLRKVTEWPETVLLGYNYLVNVDKIPKVINTVLKLIELPEKGMLELARCPLGDGKAGWRIARILQKVIESNSIKRGIMLVKKETNTYPIPLLIRYSPDVVKKYQITLCFEGSAPLTWEKMVEYAEPPHDGSTCCTCIAKSQVLDHELIDMVLKVEWRYIDELLQRTN